MTTNWSRGDEQTPLFTRDSTSEMASSENDQIYVNNTSGPSPEDQDVIIYTRLYIELAIIPFGLVLNTISLTVFCRSRLSHTSMGHFLFALAATDFTLLCTEAIGLIEKRNHDGFLLPLQCTWALHVYCKLMYYMRYVTRMMSSWLTVAITFERFLSVMYPFRIHRWSTPGRAKMTIAALVMICLGLNSYPFYTIYMPENCSGFCDVYDDIYYTFAWIGINFGTLWIPCFLVFIFTGLILVGLVRASKQNKQALSAQAGMAEKRESQDRKLMLIILAIAVSFLILRTPYAVVYYIRSNLRPDRKDWTEWRLHMISSLLWTLSTLNYCINFFFYFLLSSNFRRELRHSCACKRTMSPQTSFSYVR